MEARIATVKEEENVAQFPMLYSIAGFWIIQKSFNIHQDLVHEGGNGVILRNYRL